MVSKRVGGTKVIHVNTHVIKKNMVRLKAGKGTLEPPLTTKPKAGGKAEVGNTVAILVKGREVARVVYRPLEPLKSGAVAWVETEHDVKVVADPDPIVGAPPTSNPLLRLFLRSLVTEFGPELRKMLDEEKVSA